MAKQLHYGTTAKVFHWLIVALLSVQYPLGWFMPEIHRGAKPSDGLCSLWSAPMWRPRWRTRSSFATGSCSGCCRRTP
jgi:cytochrome b561